MKIKVAVLDQDTEFLNRLANAFEKRYEDRIILLLFSDETVMKENLKNIRVDFVLSNKKVERENLPFTQETIFVRLIEKPGIQEIDGQPTICKYQSVENIYKDIIGFYAEFSDNFVLKENISKAKRILFTSVQGGAGVSTAAAAYALRSAQKGKKIFYLNLEKFGDPDMYFSDTGTHSFSDVIYTMKSKNGNLQLRLESVICTDPSGTEFFHTCRNAYDMFEVQIQEIERLINALYSVKKYDEIVLDYSSDLTEQMMKLMCVCADRIVYVSDGSVMGNKKFEKFCEVVRVLEQRNEWDILRKTSLLYNRYSSKTGTQLEKTAVPVIGGIHRFEGIMGRDLIQSVAAVETIDRI